MKEFFERLKEFAKTTINCAKKMIRRFITWIKSNKESAAILAVAILEFGVGIWHCFWIKDNVLQHVDDVDNRDWIKVPSNCDWALTLTPKKEKVK
jgi:hypothetical protein